MMFRRLTIISLLVVPVAVEHGALAAGEPAPAPAATATILMFNLAPGGTYQVRRNNVASTSSVAGPEGVLAYQTTLNRGDRFTFLLAGVDPADLDSPAIVQRMPAPGATGVATNAGIFFVAEDAGTGVDVSTIEVSINGQVQSVTTRSTGGGIAVQCVPPDGLPADGSTQVDISVADRASPPNVTSLSYLFHTGTSTLDDAAAPLITTVSPAPGAEGADPRPVIEVRLRDAGVGVALSSVVMEINGVAVPYTFAGTPQDARIRYQPGSDFPAGSTVHVTVEACDHGSPVSCASALEYEFSVAARSAMVSGFGAIVPDGYWANDPARPLEIRNLPARWCIRIFDPSGAPVRRHENDTEGATWSWNFRNDQGQRVAPALYLVRVTDASGAVQRTGRFLVQSRQ